MALPLVFLQHRPHLLVQAAVDPIEPGGHVLVDAGFAHAELFCHRPDGGLVFYNIVAQFTGTVFHGLCQRTHALLFAAFATWYVFGKEVMNFLAIFEKGVDNRLSHRYTIATI